MEHHSGNRFRTRLCSGYCLQGPTWYFSSHSDCIQNLIRFYRFCHKKIKLAAFPPEVFLLLNIKIPPVPHGLKPTFLCSAPLLVLSLSFPKLTSPLSLVHGLQFLLLLFAGLCEGYFLSQIPEKKGEIFFQFPDSFIGQTAFQ